MVMPDENSIFCKGDCGVYNIPSPYCIDCAVEKLLEAKIRKETIVKAVKILYDEDDCKYSFEFKRLKRKKRKKEQVVKGLKL